ncbi:hypothetical protein OAJ84_03685 [Candidatus Puniceispirillum sp.]|nr:hypothetical protein [Candidatus Puniceispirillum sp.]
MNKCAGDAALPFADTQLAKRFLSWQAVIGLEAVCSYGWHWQRKNPVGVAEPAAEAGMDA